MDYKILIIDDDEPIHLFTKNILEDEFESFHARNAQEGINILSTENINIVLADIHMPGLNGLELLQALKNDGIKKDIPVMIMSNLPTIKTEKKALNMGAADFIDKTQLVSNNEEVLHRIRQKLVASVDVPNLKENLIHKKDRLVASVLESAINNGFDATVNTLCSQLKKQFNIDYLSSWLIIDGNTPELRCHLGDVSPEGYTGSDLIQETAYQQLVHRRESYYSNNIISEGMGIMKDFSQKHNLTSEIGVPIFSVTEQKLLMNGMKVSPDISLFGFICLKRNKLFSTQEFKIISDLLMRMGSVLWRLFLNK